ncbi:oxidoreductase [Campylobacter sp. MIT 12-8780]|uniref:SDR family NAD(P)-dependent oxidoreductase n=1 Tax=unclassified Campylobacter TaxID=2593542 RepID=UPI00115D4C73|nr:MULTISPECIES: SDR family oxidoreductase [unclassified Campylobacter]NDJ26472.1 SDR family oxidoreductase [Campylobacter sp. MIT 19-121]TQR43042.1 oxidoreductase [Campylobacter sp. MIT 12-8780]
MRTSKKLILISGTRKGIGKFLSEYFLEQGFIVCGCSRGKASIIHANYRHFELDISDEKAVKAMLRAIKTEFKTIDILINNAGIAAMNHIFTTPLDTAKRVFDTNFFGTFLLCREVTKMMSLAQKDHLRQNATPLAFRIINFSTVAVGLRLEGEAVYAASKASVALFTQILAKEIAPFHISVNALAPTPVRTDLIKNVPDHKLDELLEKQVIKRFGTYEDVLHVIEFFMSEKSEFITGQVLYLGGVNG